MDPVAYLRARETKVVHVDFPVPRFRGLPVPAPARGPPLSAPWLAGRLALGSVLDGHNGCVNCLAWNAQGSKLLSGSDDRHLCVWAYPALGREDDYDEDPTVDAHWRMRSAKGLPAVRDTYQRRPLAKVRTGHRANIFGCKFMPQTNDTILASCAGDSEVRVHALRPTESNDGTLLHVFTCHSDRAKRLAVHASAPYLILSCSEDGTLRMHDLRLPHPCRQPTSFSSALPSPPRPRDSGCTPLVDYSPFGIDFNTAAIHPGRPNLVALGGSSPSLFLHDLRQPAKPFLRLSPTAPSSMVREPRPSDPCESGHVTAAAWSADGAVVGNWSGGWVYGFEGVDGTGWGSEWGWGFLGAAGGKGGESKKGKRKGRMSEESERSTEASSEAGPERKSPRRTSPDADRLPTTAPASDVVMDAEPIWKPDELDLEPTVQPVLADAAEAVGKSSDASKGHRAQRKPELRSAVEKDEESEIDEEEGYVSGSDPVDMDDESEDGSDAGSESPSSHSDHDRRPRRRYAVPFPDTTHTTTYDRVYRGAANVQTVKDVAFLGPGLVACGSDDGNLFLFPRDSSTPRNVLRGDGNVVNVAQIHPHGTAIAVSGIDRTVKVFEPTWGVPVRMPEEREAAAGPAEDDPGPWGLGFPLPVPTNQLGSLKAPMPLGVPFTGPEDEQVALPKGWSMLEHLPEIEAANARRRRGGGGAGARVSRQMLLALLGRLRERTGGDVGIGILGDEEEEEEDEEGEEENCYVQ
ncbi:WD40-repeat-containing domain protein [Hyaloraphidium curvatum]|nr:WD40-repeat-containing domain protein [Hyaloraphidium curvatum]